MIPYLGNKYKYRDFIVPNIPLDIKTYVEPFGGMFGVFFSLDLNKYNLEKVVYNDINPLNYNLFKNIDYVLEQIDKINSNEYIYYHFQDINSNCELENAVEYLYLLCHSNIAGNIFSEYRDRGVWKNIKHFKKYFDIIDTKLKMDYTEIFNIFDSKDTFFYVDPPYLNFEDRYVNHPFNKDSHLELFKALQNIKGRFMLSYYECDWVTGIYGHGNYNILSKNISYNNKNELLIMNY